MVRRKRSSDRDELLDDEKILREYVIELVSNADVRKFAKNFGKLMSIRTGKLFLCIYHPRLQSPVNAPVRKKSNSTKTPKINPFVRTFITDSRESEVIISLISDEIGKNSKIKIKYVLGMLENYNPLSGVLLNGK